MRDRELLAAYRATTWRVWTPEGVHTLRLDGGPSPFPLRPAGIVTAYNPASTLRPREENERANERLREEIEAAGGTAHPATAGGTGPDAELWTEPGFAVTGMPREALASLAGRFGQNAIVWIDPAGAPSLRVTRAGFCGLSPGDPLP